MAKIRYLTDLGWPGEIHLVFAVKTEDDIIFRDELDYLRRRFPNLRVTVTLTRDDGTSWPGERGRISPELLNRVVPRLSERRVHICGPGEMTESIIQMLHELGVPDERIRLESFAPAGRPEASASKSAPDEHAGTVVTATEAEMAAASSAPAGSCLGHVRPSREIEAGLRGRDGARSFGRPGRRHRVRLPSRHLRPVQDQAPRRSRRHGCARCPRSRRSTEQRDSQLPGTLRRSSRRGGLSNGGYG